MVGEFERAFAGRQFHEVAVVLAAQGVAVWLPETDGPVDLAGPGHRVLMHVLAAQSQREVVRSRHRTLAAMTAQTVEQGRFLGGRPPYGYRLVDAGPHPNRAHAAWGRRRQRLDPDPAAAPTVRWIFAERLAGCSVAGIARELHERCAVPVLANPRYTGREVWGRHQSATPGGGRRVIPAEWAISTAVAHPALVCEADFVAVQQVRAARMPDDGVTRRYQLAGLIRCGLCGRFMDAHWVNGRAGYRCRHGYSSARLAPPGRPKNLYVREDHLLQALTQRQLVGGAAYASDARAAMALLQSQGMVIVHDRTGWRVAVCGDV